MQKLTITKGAARFTFPEPWRDENDVEQHAALEHTITRDGALVEDEFVKDVVAAARKKGITVKAEPMVHDMFKGWVPASKA